MSFKEALIKGLKVAGWLLLAIIPFIAGICALLAIIPFIAGICAKEGAENGFETFIGWAAMAEAVAIAVLGIVLGRKRDDSAGK